MFHAPPVKPVVAKPPHLRLILYKWKFSRDLYLLQEFRGTDQIREIITLKYFKSITLILSIK